MKNRLVAFALGLCCLAGAAGSAAAQDQISLRLGSLLAPSHWIEAYGTKVFMDEMTERTGGKVQFQYFPSEQLAKSTELLNAVQLGVVDVGEIVPSYFADKLPASGILEMPSLTDSSCAAGAAFRAISQPGTPLYDSEYKPNGVRILSYIAYPAYSFHSMRPIRSIEDFKGVKVRVSGPGMELAVAKLGGVGVKVPAAEIYDAVARGTVDATLQGYQAIVHHYGLHDVVKHSLTGYPFGQSAIFLGISEKKFQALPADVQEAMIEAGKAAEKSACEFVDSDEAASRELAAAAGVEISEVSDELRAQLDARLESVAADWAANLDKQGRPGTQTLEAYKAALAN